MLLFATPHPLLAWRRLLTLLGLDRQIQARGRRKTRIFGASPSIATVFEPPGCRIWRSGKSG
jgi:hypothetical protein